jgi:WD40 repeat protein
LLSRSRFCSLIGHYAPITAVAVSSVWDVVVSSSSNGSVIVWDLNSFSPICVINSLHAAASSISIGDWLVFGGFVRKLEAYLTPRSAVFAVACESYLTVFDINGRLIADMDLKTNHNTGHTPAHQKQPEAGFAMRGL